MADLCVAGALLKADSIGEIEVDKLAKLKKIHVNIHVSAEQDIGRWSVANIGTWRHYRVRARDVIKFSNPKLKSH